jgi:hypothetical protein
MQGKPRYGAFIRPGPSNKASRLFLRWVVLLARVDVEVGQENEAYDVDDP